MPGERILFTVALLGAAGSGLIAGAFFAFSTFVMRALALRPAREGIAAMQSINVVVLNPVFLGTFLGTALVGLAAAVLAWVRWPAAGSAWLLAAGLLYVIGTFGVTVIGNVPMNNALAARSSDDPESAQYWATYVSRWTMWNHARTLAALASMLSFAMALRS